MIVEPCCAKRQLPEVMNAGDRFFQTSGDVLMTKFIDAAVPMEKSKYTKFFLSCAELDYGTLAEIKGYLLSGYFGSAVILTRKANIPEKHKYDTDIEIIEDPMIIDGLMAFIGVFKSIIIQGAMLAEVDLSICLYSCYYGNDEQIINTAIAPLISRVHLAKKKNKT